MRIKKKDLLCVCVCVCVFCGAAKLWSLNYENIWNLYPSAPTHLPPSTHTRTHTLPLFPITIMLHHEHGTAQQSGWRLRVRGITPDYSVWMITEDAAVASLVWWLLRCVSAGCSFRRVGRLWGCVSPSHSLLRNPGLTHAILICLLRDNHDPEEENRSSNTGWFISSFIPDSSDLSIIRKVFLKDC